jgi:hypothetical protein
VYYWLCLLVRPGPSPHLHPPSVLLPIYPPSPLPMSTINQTAGPSRSTDNFTAIFQAALNEYHTVTGKSLDTQPFAAQLDDCNSPEAFSNVLRTQAKALSKFRKGDEKLMVWLDPTIDILYTFSRTLGERIGLVSHLIRLVLSFSNIWPSAILTREKYLHRHRCSSCSKFLPCVPCHVHAIFNLHMLHRQQGVLWQATTPLSTSSSAFTSSFNV